MSFTTFSTIGSTNIVLSKKQTIDPTRGGGG
jgi:hypothetical protein